MRQALSDRSKTRTGLPGHSFGLIRGCAAPWVSMRLVPFTPAARAAVLAVVRSFAHQNVTQRNSRRTLDAVYLGSWRSARSWSTIMAMNDLEAIVRRLIREEVHAVLENMLP